MINYTNDNFVSQTKSHSFLNKEGNAHIHGIKDYNILPSLGIAFIRGEEYIAKLRKQGIEVTDQNGTLNFEELQRYVKPVVKTFTRKNRNMKIT